MKVRKINIHMFFILLAATLWGTAGIFVRTAAVLKVTEMELVFGRSFFTAIFIAVIMLLKDINSFKIKFRDLWLFVCAGIFSIILFNFSYYTTMSLSTISVAAVLLYTSPFFVVIISRFLFGKKLTANKCTACVVAFFGCTLVSGIFDKAQRIGAKALIFGLLTGLGYALYTIFSELLLNRGYKTLTITFYVFFFSAICCSLFVNVPKTVGYTFSNLNAFTLISLMALINTVIPYILYTVGLSGVDVSIAPIIATVEPVVATVVGAVIFKESITFFGIIGILLVLFSVLILNRKIISIRANAKVNLILSIIGKREDGYHLIDTVMQSVGLSDSLKITPSKRIRVKCDKKELSGEENIAFRAAKLFFEVSKINGGANIYIKKRIPTAAGLGGGSADAAGVLMGLNRLYRTNLTNDMLCEMALCLGADVPFFIMGGTVRAEGIGEKLTKLKPFNKGYFLLVKANEKPSTAEMYRRLDEENHVKPDINSFIKAVESENYIKAANLMENSFKAVWKEDNTEKLLLSYNPVSVSLSGSGPTQFGFYFDKRKAKKALFDLKKQGIDAYLVKPLKKSLIIE